MNFLGVNKYVGGLTQALIGLDLLGLDLSSTNYGFITVDSLITENEKKGVLMGRLDYSRPLLLWLIYPTVPIIKYCYPTVFTIQHIHPTHQLDRMIV